MNNKLIRYFVVFYILVLSHSAYAWTDACWLIDKMLDDGCNITFEKYKGNVIEGTGYFSDVRDGWIIICCEKNAINNPLVGRGMIYMETGEARISFRGLKRGDKIYFRGEARRWKLKKYSDTKRPYIRLELDYNAVAKKVK